MLFPRICIAGATFVAVVFGVQVAQAESWFDRISLVEMKGGVIAHDVTEKGNHSNSVDLNLEFTFANTKPFDFGHPAVNFMLNPRAIIGASVNLEGDTHQAYVAFDWLYQFDNGIFVEGSFGALGHTGNLEQKTVACSPGAGCSGPGNTLYVDTGEPSLGFPVLFREHIEIGYRMDNGWAISVLGAHISNGGLNTDNDGMDFVGLRVGYTFRQGSR